MVYKPNVDRYVAMYIHTRLQFLCNAWFKIVEHQYLFTVTSVGCPALHSKVTVVYIAWKYLPFGWLEKDFAQGNELCNG